MIVLISGSREWRAALVELYIGCCLISVSECLHPHVRHVGAPANVNT